MPETEIIRSKIIVVDTVSKNSYGDLVFIDKEGTEYKISAKRLPWFEKIIVPGIAVQLDYAKAYNKEYIWKATQVKDDLPAQSEVPIEKPKDHLVDAAKKARAVVIPDKDEERIRSMGLAYAKDVMVACIRAGLIKELKLELHDRMFALANEFVHYIKGENV